MAVRRIEFDSTIDEVVDVNMQMVKQTTTYHQQRGRMQWTLAVCAAGGVAVALLRGRAAPSYAALAIASSAALTVGIVLGMLYGWYHDRYIRQHYRRMVDEMYGHAEVIHWEFEVRPDTLWTRSQHAEVAFPWSRLRRISDAPGSIELWFDPGLAVVRDRVFSGQEDRQEFLDTVRRYLPEGAV
jgi:hypothetical protein